MLQPQQQQQQHEPAASISNNYKSSGGVATATSHAAFRAATAKPADAAAATANSLRIKWPEVKRQLRDSAVWLWVHLCLSRLQRGEDPASASGDMPKQDCLFASCLRLLHGSRTTIIFYVMSAVPNPPRNMMRAQLVIVLTVLNGIWKRRLLWCQAFLAEIVLYECSFIQMTKCLYEWTRVLWVNFHKGTVQPDLRGVINNIDRYLFEDELLRFFFKIHLAKIWWVLNNCFSAYSNRHRNCAFLKICDGTSHFFTGFHWTVLSPL